MTASKRDLFEAGKILTTAFCGLNDLPNPNVVEGDAKRWPFGVCAYYRNHVTTIVVDKCATIGTAGMQWSYPGHSVDRTPYGVLQHELGHHVDWLRSTKRGAYFGDWSVDLRKCAAESPLTSYCPNDAEWLAEMFRLFVTNPALLAALRPRTYDALAEQFIPVFSDGWRARIDGAPARTLLSIERKLAKSP